MAELRRGGLIHLSFTGGAPLLAKGHFEIVMGKDKRKAIYSTSCSGAVGYTSEPQSAKISGEILFDKKTQIEKIIEAQGVDVVLELADGTILTLKDGFFTEEGTLNTEENSMKFCIEGRSIDIVTSK